MNAILLLTGGGRTGEKINLDTVIKILFLNLTPSPFHTVYPKWSRSQQTSNDYHNRSYSQMNQNPTLSMFLENFGLGNTLAHKIALHQQERHKDQPTDNQYAILTSCLLRDASALSLGGSSLRCLCKYRGQQEKQIFRVCRYSVLSFSSGGCEAGRTGFQSCLNGS